MLNYNVSVNRWFYGYSPFRALKSLKSVHVLYWNFYCKAILHMNQSSTQSTICDVQYVIFKITGYHIPDVGSICLKKQPFTLLA